MLILLPNTISNFGMPILPSEVGFLVSPNKYYSEITKRRLTGFRWALDNGCYGKGDRFDFDAYLRLIKLAKTYPGTMLFAVVPDVVGDAAATYKRWVQYAPGMRFFDVPLAYVAQDGLLELPDVEFDCLFIGGTTPYKLSPTVVALVAQAKQQGKWVHMGRVNSVKRMTHAYKLGVDSVDGTTWAHAPKEAMRLTIPALRALKSQGVLHLL